MLNLILQLAYIIGNRIHTQGIKASVEHVSLDANFVERFAESPHSGIGIFASQQVHLLEGSSVGFHTVKAPHVDDGRSHTFQLILAWLELT